MSASDSSPKGAASPSKTSSSTSPSSSEHEKPLATLPANTTSPRKPTTTDTLLPASYISKASDEMPTTRSEQAATYISPSDNILSPTTKKLSEIKGRRFANAKTRQLGSRALFQKAVLQGKENSPEAKGQLS